MAIELSPKKQFQNQFKEAAEQFANLIQQPALKVALTFAFAQLGHGPVTPEELMGAKKFIVIFTNLSDVQEDKELPKRELTAM